MIQQIQHITSSQHYCQSNRFIIWSIKTIKDALIKSNFNKHTLHDILYHLWLKHIDPHIPSTKEIIHNRTDERPGQPFNPMDMKMSETSSQRKSRHKRNTTIKGTEPRTYLHYSHDTTSTSSTQKDPMAITSLTASYPPLSTSQLYSQTPRPLISLHQTSHVCHWLLWI